MSGCAHAHLWGYAAGMQSICVTVQLVTFKAGIYDHSWTTLSAVVYRWSTIEGQMVS